MPLVEKGRKHKKDDIDKKISSLSKEEKQFLRLWIVLMEKDPIRIPALIAGATSGYYLRRSQKK